MSIVEVVLFVLRDALWSGVAALGFAILFNVPVRTLFACAMGGAIGHLTRTVLMEWGLDIEAATLAGATLVGILGEVAARRWYAPSPVFTVPAVIPLVPGVFAYHAMIGVLRLTSASDYSGAERTDLLLTTVTDGSKATLIVMAIAIGIALPKLLIRRRVV